MKRFLPLLLLFFLTVDLQAGQTGFSALTLDETPEITLANSETLGNGTDGTFLFSRNTDAAVTLQGADSSGASDLVLDTTGAGAITIGSADVTSVSIVTDGGTHVIDGALSSLAIPIRFCGQGPNATTAVYLSPDTQDGNGSLAGSAHCDAEDDVTEATADEVLFNSAIKAVGLVCEITDGGTDDDVTFQLRDDTADVSGLTCDVTMTGSGVKTCTVQVAAPVTIAAGSALAVSAVAATDDDLSSADILCTLLATF